MEVSYLEKDYIVDTLAIRTDRFSNGELRDE